MLHVGKVVVGTRQGGLLAISAQKGRSPVVCLIRKLPTAVAQVEALERGRTLLVATLDHRLGIYHTESGKLLHSFHDHVNDFSCLPRVSLDESLQVICAIGTDNVVRMWHLYDGGRLGRDMMPPETAFESDGPRLHAALLPSRRGLAVAVYSEEDNRERFCLCR
jgi:WD40 repeat protein